MATEFIDGTFSQTKGFKDAFDDFKNHMESGLARSFHIGTDSEIEEIKRKADFSSRIEDIESKLKAIDADNKLSKLNIIKPTQAQIKSIAKDK